MSANPTRARNAADLDVRVLARLKEAVQLQDQALADHDRGVRLLDGESSLPHQVRLEAGRPARHEPTDARFTPDRIRQRGPEALAIRGLPTVDEGHEVALRADVVIEGRLEHDQRSRPDRRSIDLGYRDDRALLRAEPALGREVGRSHPASGAGQSMRNRTIGHGTPPSIQSWSGTSITRPLRS